MRSVRGSLLVAAGLACLAACSTSTAGSPSSSGSSTEPSTSSSAPTSTAASSTPVSPSSSGPNAVAPPSICNGSQCSSQAQATFGQYQVRLYAAPSSTAGEASVIELLDNTAPVYWKVIDGDRPLGVTCSATPSPNCVVVDGTGAHASTFYGFRVTPTALVQFDMNGADTPGAFAQDLNGDGWIDVVAEQNTYQPNYAAGTVYWQTFTSDGSKLTSTGCSSPVAATQLGSRPTAPLTGACTA